LFGRRDGCAEGLPAQAALHAGRKAPDEVTLFESAGFAPADLAAARLAMR